MTINLEFPHGIPAFETETRFRLTESAEREPLLFLESEANPELSFLLLPVATIDPDYRLALSAEDRETLGDGPESRFVCLAVITAAEDSPPTANLLAPIVVNLDSANPGSLRAVQAVRADRVYSHKHPLIPEGAACS